MRVLTRNFFICTVVFFLSPSLSHSAAEDSPQESLRTLFSRVCTPFSYAKAHEDGSASFWDLNETTLSVRQVEREGPTYDFSLEGTGFYPFNVGNYAYIPKRQKRLFGGLSPAQVLFSAGGEEAIAFTSEHPGFSLTLLTPPPHDSSTLYFAEYRTYDSNNNACRMTDPHAARVSTNIYSYSPETRALEIFGTFPVSATPLFSETGEPFFASLESDGLLQIRRVNPDNSADVVCIWSHVIKFLSQPSESPPDIVLSKDGEGLFLLLPGTTAKQLLIPHYVKFSTGERRPLLSEEEQERLPANVTSFLLDPVTNALLCYATDGLDVQWHTPATSPDQAPFVAMLNEYQSEAGQNLLFLSGKDHAGYLGEQVILQSTSPYLNEMLLFKRDASSECPLKPLFRSRPYDIPDLTAVRIEKLLIEGRHGYPIPAYLVRPSTAEGPTSGVVYIKGGPSTRTDTSSLNTPLYLAHLGYPVVIPQYSGTSSFGKAFADRRWKPEAAADDLIDVTREMVTQQIFNEDRTMVMGVSYGAYLTALLVAERGHEFAYCGGIAEGGMYDPSAQLISSLGCAPYSNLLQAIGFPHLDDFEAWKKMPNITHGDCASKISVPFVLIHGDKDEICSFTQAEGTSAALKSADVGHAFLRLQNVGHSPSCSDMPLLFYLKEVVLARLFKLTTPHPLTTQERTTKFRVIHDTLGWYSKDNFFQ